MNVDSPAGAVAFLDLHLDLRARKLTLTSAKPPGQAGQFKLQLDVDERPASELIAELLTRSGPNLERTLLAWDSI